jgi:hypothetical protein
MIFATASNLKFGGMVLGTKFHLSMNNLASMADLRLKFMIRRLLYYLQRSQNCCQNRVLYYKTGFCNGALETHFSCTGKAIVLGKVAALWCNVLIVNTS